MLLLSKALIFMSHRTMDTLFPFFLYVFPHLKKERKKKNNGILKKIWSVAGKQKIQTGFQAYRTKNWRERESDFPRSLEVCFKAKLQQEGSCDFKQGFKVKDPIQTLLLHRSYCDGNDMVRGKWWFYLEWGERETCHDWCTICRSNRKITNLLTVQLNEIVLLIFLRIPSFCIYVCVCGTTS